MTDVKLYEFHVNGMETNTFTVVKFKGQEALSTLYTFDIVLISTTSMEDFVNLVNKEASLIYLRPDKNIHYNGIISQFEYLQISKYFYLYRAILTPKVWRATRTQSSKIYLNKTTQAIVSEVLNDTQLHPDIDFSINLSTVEDAWDYVCMFNESAFNFISQHMERNGIYYFFEQNVLREVMRIVDNKDVHEVKAEGETLSYAYSWEPKKPTEYIYSFHLRQSALPKQVIVRDYNYDKANLTLQGEADVDKDNGLGEVYTYGEHVRGMDEAKALAQVRAQELTCRHKHYNGASTAPSLRPGYTFTLKGHAISEFDTSYLITEVLHKGHQIGYLHSIFGVIFGNSSDDPTYKNTFSCIESQTQFRPERKTQKSRFHGIIAGAVIDGAGDDGKPYLDEKGRYTVIMPFDLSGRKDGKASCWLRMMHPFAGKDVGFHFPLLKGTEALIAFLDGDPDRPVIVGAAHNSESPSIITNANSYLNAMQTASGQVLWISDKSDDEHILYGTTEKQSALKLESPKDANYASKTEFTGNKLTFLLGNYDRCIAGNKVDSTVGTKTEMTVAPHYKVSIGPKYEATLNAPKSVRKKMYGLNMLSKLGIAFTPLNVKFNNNDSFEFGDSSTFTAKDSKTSLGQVKACMFGGAHESVDLLLKKAAKAVGICTTISMAAGIGAAIGQGAFLTVKKPTYTSASDNITRNMAFIGTAMAIPTLSAMIMNNILCKIHTQAKDIIENQHLVGGEVRCTKDGVSIRANNPLLSARLAGAQVDIRTMGSSLAGEEASICLATKGKSIQMLCGGSMATSKSSFSMEGDKFYIDATGSTSVSSLQMQSSMLKATVDTGKSKLTLTGTENELALGASNSITQNTSGISLAVQTSKFNVTSSGIEVLSGTKGIKISKFSLDVNSGTVSLKGSAINIG